jgi:hypothetical protein
MKKYFLTKALLVELIEGNKSNKEKIVTRLEDLLKKNESLFTSIVTINQILESEPELEKRKIIFRNLNLVLEKILPLDNSDLPLALSLESEFNIVHEMAVELATATKNEMDFIVDTSERFKFQKMISVIGLILEGK